MEDNKATTTDRKILVEDMPLASLGMPVIQKTATKKRIRRIAEPHIRSHKVYGYIYYYYVRGEDQEIYLGSADSILKAVTGRGKYSHYKGN
jgi:hypothetical protein